MSAAVPNSPLPVQVTAKPLKRRLLGEQDLGKPVKAAP